MSEDFKTRAICRIRVFDSNAFLLLSNAVSPSTEGLENVVANHDGRVIGVMPDAEVFLLRLKTDFTD